MKQVHLYIAGDVIGVGFRAWCAIQAKKFGVTGWVKNVFDHPEIFGTVGGVEVVIQGPEEALSKMIAVLKIGPSIARVDNVKILWERAEAAYNAFKILQ